MTENTKQHFQNYFGTGLFCEVFLTEYRENSDPTKSILRSLFDNNN
jgi:hypothetical protein